MKLCTMHQHSSEKTALKCYSERIGKRADKKLIQFGCLVSKKFRQIQFNPPMLVSGPVNIFYFYKGEEK